MTTRCLSFWKTNISWFCGKGFPADSRYSNGNKLRPSSIRHLSLLIRRKFIQSLLSSRKKLLASRFNFTYRYIDDVLSLKQPNVWKVPRSYVFCWSVDQRHQRKHHFRFLPRYTPVDRERGQLHTYIYDKRDVFNFNITNFTFLSNNILRTSPAYGVLVSQFTRYTGLVPRVHVYFEFWGSSDFDIHFLQFHHCQIEFHPFENEFGPNHIN